MRSLALRVILGGALIAGWSSSAAAAQYWDYFGDGPSTIYVGTDPYDGNSQWIGYQDQYGNCAWDYVAGGSGYTETVTVMGMGGGDAIFEVPSGGVYFCDYLLEPPILNGHQLNFNGGDGSDWLVQEPGHTGSFSSYSWMEGDYCTNLFCSGDPAYHDILVAYADDWTDQPQMFGDNGDDVLWASISTSSAYMSGGAGNDCIQVNSSAATVSCGSGSDSWHGVGTRPADCESTTTSSCY